MTTGYATLRERTVTRRWHRQAVRSRKPFARLLVNAEPDLACTILGERLMLRIKYAKRPNERLFTILVAGEHLEYLTTQLEDLARERDVFRAMSKDWRP